MLDCMIIKTDDIEPVVYEWGAVKWVANADLAPGCGQSFGYVNILPGKTNPEHWHTAATSTAGNRLSSSKVRLASPLAPSPPIDSRQACAFTSGMSERW